MRAKIDAGGRMVELETADANIKPADIAEIVYSMWEKTTVAGATSQGPAFGVQAQTTGARLNEPLSGGVLREVKATHVEYERT